MTFLTFLGHRVRCLHLVHYIKVMLTLSIEWLRLLHDHNNGRTLCEFTNHRGQQHLENVIEVRISLKHKPALRDRLFTAVLAGVFVHDTYLVYPYSSFLFFLIKFMSLCDEIKCGL